ncbi:MAG: hypothetical protein HY822_05875 [Acidobacteria bacterium]|nr:hypothetical protein [Acidobacteriota bacterium]
MRRLIWILTSAAALAAPPSLLRVPMSASGAPVTARELKASVDGAAARVAAVRAPGDDLILMLALDLTGDLTLADLARSALAESLSTLPARTWISVLRAQDGLQVLLDPTQDRTRAAETIRAYPASGKAGLLDTVAAAARVADAVLTRANVRVAVLYVTDSNVYNYREDFTNPVINSSDSRDLSRYFPEGLVQDKISKLETALAATQPPLFIVHLDYRSDRLNEAYQSGLMKLTASTGGSAAFCRSATDIDSSIARTLETIGALYSVTLELPQRTGRMIQVQLEAGDRPLNYRNRYLLEKR